MKLQKKLMVLLFSLALLPAAAALLFWGDLPEYGTRWDFILWCAVFLLALLLLCAWLSKRMVKIWRTSIQRDFLTHLYNKGETEIRIKQCLLEDREQAMIIVDIDNFKQLNDTLGHLYGDAVLQAAAERMKRIFSGEDFVGRIGGDEFLIFLHGPCNPRELSERMDQLNQLFLQPVASGTCSKQVSVSMGAACRQKEESFDSLFNRADQALYEAKREGKSCYRIAEREKRPAKF